jgi:hypothetical protein
MSVQVSDPAGDQASSVADVFLARHAEILSAIAPVANQGAAVSEPTPATPPAASEDHGEDQSEDYSEGLDSSAGFLQFPSEEDLEDDPDATGATDTADDEDGEDGDDDLLGLTSLPRSRSTLQKLRTVDWKSTKVLAGGLCTLVAVVVLVIVLFKPSPAAPAQLTISAAPPPKPSPTAAPVHDAPIKIASSTGKCPGSSDDSSNAFDGQMDTAWKCKDPYGPGQKLTMYLGEPNVISELTIVPGFNKFSSSGDEWTNYQTVTKVRWLFGTFDPNKPCSLDNNCLETNTDNKRDTVSIPVKPNKTTSVITMVILKTTSPPSTSGPLTDPSNKVDSFAVSEVQVIGHRPE